MAQAALIRREKLATLGQLTERIAQEIRSPLGTVAASLYVLKSTLRNMSDARVEEILGRADRSVKRCDRIVTELFTYSDRQPPSFQETALDAWLDSLLEKFEWPAGADVHIVLTSGVVLSIDRENLARPWSASCLTQCRPWRSTTIPSD